MRKRILSFILTLCMVLTLMPVVAQPVTAQAATSSPVQTVKIGTATLNEANKYYHNGEEGAQGEANDSAEDANATFDAATGTLILNGLNITTAEPGIWWEYSGSGAHDLTIVLNNTNTISNSNGCGILGERGYSNGPSLTIKGSGSLNVTGSTCGIWVWNNITICDSVKVNATGTSKYGICNNISSGTITFEDSAVVTATGGIYGIAYDNGDLRFNVPVIKGGTVTLTGGTAAVRVKEDYTENSPELSGYTSGCKVTVGENAESSGEWNIGNPLKNYKYIKIEQGSHTHSWDSAWSTDATHHWHECEHYGCDKTEASSKDSYGSHVYDDDSDTTCNTCGYIRTPVTTIDSVDVTITAPTGGDELPAKASVSAAGVSATEVDIAWKRGDTAASGKAGYNTAYTANVTLAADTGYAFKSGVTAMINTDQPGEVNENTDGTITVSYTFPATGTTDLSTIRSPQNITGVENGTAKTATALGLPTVVTIDTKDSKTSTATVTWDLENLASGSYDPSIRTAQTFTVNGTVALPTGIGNTDDVSLNVVIQVTVSAASSSGGGNSIGGTTSEVTTRKDAASNTATTTSPTEVKVENGTASATVKAENMAEAIRQATYNKSAEIVFTVSEKESGNADTIRLTISKSDAQQILDQTVADLVVATPEGDVSLSQGTMGEVLQAAEGTDLTIEVAKVTNPTEAQKQAVGDNGYIAGVTIVSQNKAITTFGGKTLTIRLEIPAALLNKEVVAIHIADDGTTEKMPGKVVTEGTKKYYEFTTTHLSTFALIEETPTVTAPKKGSLLTDSKTKMVYKVTKSGKTGGTVKFVKTGNTKAKIVAIPDKVTIDGITYKVTSVAANALKNNTTVTTVTIGKYVTSIGSGAFSGCSKLKKVTIGKSVTTIGSKAFYKCTSLTSITIPSKVKKIGDYAFKGCTKLKTINLNTTLLTTETVSEYAFSGVPTSTVIQVLKSKAKAYKKLLVKKGLSKKVTIKNL